MSGGIALARLAFVLCIILAVDVTLARLTVYNIAASATTGHPV
jgi:hypothetical protein